MPAADTDVAALKDRQLEVLGDAVAEHLDTAALARLITHGPPPGMPRLSSTLSPRRSSRDSAALHLGHRARLGGAPRPRMSMNCYTCIYRVRSSANESWRPSALTITRINDHPHGGRQIHGHHRERPEVSR